MVIKLYGSRHSSCTQRVLMVLSELNLDYELSDVNPQLGEHKRPEYIQESHPFGLIPALEDDGLRLFESRAICRYLLAKYGKDHELNYDHQGSAEELGAYEQALSVEYSYFQPTVFGLAYELMFKGFAGGGEPDPAVVERHRSTLVVTLDYYENVLATSEYLAKDAFTLVDLYHLPWIPYLERLGLEAEITSRPNFEAWTKRAFARPSWQALQS